MMRSTLIVALVCAPVLVFAQETPEPFVAASTKTITGTIQAISQSDRHVVLQGTGGTRLILEAGPGVSNFDNVKPGDRVVVNYQEGLIAAVTPPGEGVQGTARAAGPAPDGDLPGAVAGEVIATTVTIKSVDKAANKVTFERPDGTERTLSVSDPKAREFVHGLKSGDEVQLTYKEALAVSIEPAKG